MATPALAGAVKSITGTSATNTLVSDSFTPSANATLIVMIKIVINDGGGPSTNFTLTNTHTMKAGTPGTWRQANTRADDVGGGFSVRTSIWYAKCGATPGAGTITVTRTAGNVYQAFWCVYTSVTNVADDPVGTQVATLDVSGGTTDTATLPATPATASLVMMCVHDAAGAGANIGPPTNCTELSDSADATDGSRFETAYDDVGAGTTYTWSGLVNLTNGRWMNVVEFLSDSDAITTPPIHQYNVHRM